MASFADKFLKDLEDLSADEHEEEEEIKEEEEDADFAEYEEREQKVEKLLQKGYTSKVRGNPEFTRHLESLEADQVGEFKGMENLSQKEVALRLIVTTNEFLKHIDNDILIVHKELRDLYVEKFSELESIILNPVDYARTVKIISNATGDISRLLE